MPRELTTDERLRYASMFGLRIYRENPGMSVGESFVAGLRRADEAKIITREELLLNSEAQLPDYLSKVWSDPAGHGLLTDELSLEDHADVALEARVSVIDRYENPIAKISSAQED
ncbi:hypothetical protein BKG82_26870 [Mycobacteroides chelonae]|uniref:Uncharacterized protein n=1 Tax=Mycobacteroides chelonae TaxID=1774 RepID=A0A1S1LIN5_MYCCH|nr:hypothetical protein [Mycobacteroides chelonae]OHU47276.1 hypothetical protein BKG82_26870 [Mycobacteroides chelonae]